MTTYSNYIETITDGLADNERIFILVPIHDDLTDDESFKPVAFKHSLDQNQVDLKFYNTLVEYMDMHPHQEFFTYADVFNWFTPKNENYHKLCDFLAKKGFEIIPTPSDCDNFRIHIADYIEFCGDGTYRAVTSDSIVWARAYELTHDIPSDDQIKFIGDDIFVFEEHLGKYFAIAAETIGQAWRYIAKCKYASYIDEDEVEHTYVTPSPYYNLRYVIQPTLRKYGATQTTEQPRWPKEYISIKTLREIIGE